MSSEISRFLRTVERSNLILAAVVLLASGLALGFGPSLASVAVGVLVSAANFRVIAWIGRKVTQSSPRSRTFFFLLFLGKFAVLVALVYLLVVRVRVDVVPFIVGLSTLFVTVTFEAYRTMLTAARRSSDGEGAVESPVNRELP